LQRQYPAQPKLDEDVSSSDLPQNQTEAKPEDVDVHVINMAGEVVADLSMPVTCDVKGVKRAIEAICQIHPVRQRLLLGSTVVSDSALLAAFQQPLTLSLVVVLAYDAKASSLLQDAARTSDAFTAEQALRALADPNVTDWKGKTPIYMASSLGHLALVRLLCEDRASMNQKTLNGRTPLYIASMNGYAEVVRFLCDAGAAKDLAVDNDMTPLHIASSFGRLEVVRVLCEAGAAWNRKTQSGWTPLRFASACRHPGVACLLREVEQRDALRLA